MFLAILTKKGGCCRTIDNNSTLANNFAVGITYNVKVVSDIRFDKNPLLTSLNSEHKWFL